jgi:hypothetical protein
VSIVAESPDPLRGRYSDTAATVAFDRREEATVAAEIVMSDGTRFVTTPSTKADSLIKNFERRSFAQIELEDEIIYINPAHVAYIRDS